MSGPKRGSLMDLPKRVELTKLESTRSVEELERTFLTESETERPTGQPADPSIDRTMKQSSGLSSNQADNRPAVHLGDRTNGEPSVRTDVYTPSYTRSRPSRAIEPSAEQGKEGSPDSLVARIRREPRGAVKIVGYKIPGDLKEELEAVARYNNSDMTRIVVEGIRLALSQLPHPPDWSRRQKV